MEERDFNTKYQPTWCPGCGDYGIWAALKESFVKLKWKPDEFVIVYGIGCSGNMNDFIASYGFHALHGRALPNARGIKLANRTLPVICVVGDGDCYGEGGNHLIHTARANFDLTVIVHDNKVYGLTTGQAAPTAETDFKSKSTPRGTVEEPLDPLTLAIAQGATFVAQGISNDIPHLKELIVSAIKHKGFSLVNVLQPCMTFNKINTYRWYQERVYKLDKNNPYHDKIEALKKLASQKKIPLGIIYQEEKQTYEQSLPQIREKSLIKQKLKIRMDSLLKEFAS